MQFWLVQFHKKARWLWIKLLKHHTMARFSFWSVQKKVFHMQKSNPIEKVNIATKYKINSEQMDLFWADYEPVFNSESLEFRSTNYTPIRKLVVVLDWFLEDYLTLYVQVLNYTAPNSMIIVMFGIEKCRTKRPKFISRWYPAICLDRLSKTTKAPGKRNRYPSFEHWTCEQKERTTLNLDIIVTCTLVYDRY
jgi:hypothetical protein